MSTTAEKPGIKEHILAALTRPMDADEIAEATGCTIGNVHVALSDLIYQTHQVRITPRGLCERAPERVVQPPAAPTRTVAEYESLEASQSPAAASAPPPPVPPASSSHMLPRVALANIQEDAGNIRHEFDPVELQALADSIAKHGLLQPLLVRPNPADSANPPYQLIAGARRFRACLLAGVEQVPVLVRRDVTDAEVIEMMLAENDDRTELNPIERANAYKRLAELGVPKQEIAKRAGLSPARVSNALAVLELSDPLQEQVAAGGLSESHGRALLRHPEGIRDALAAHAIAAGLPSKALDVETAKLEWSVVYALHDAGAVRMYPQFELCRACPHDALINSGVGPAVNSGWCVNPACYDELDAARKLTIETDNQRVLAEARDHEAIAGHIPADGELPTVERLREQHPDYRVIHTTPPAGCSGECECRRQAQQTNLDGRLQIIPVCINAERLHSLQHAQSTAISERMRQDQAAREQEEQSERENLVAAIQARADDPALLVAAVGRLIWTGEMDLVPEVVSRHAPEIEELVSAGDFDPAMDALSKLPSATLIRIAGELALLEPDEAGDAVSQWFQARPAAEADPEQWALSDTLAQLATLKIELRNVRNQLEHAQKLLQGGTLDASRSGAETQRLLTEARAQVAARERTIEGLNKQIEHMRQARERTETPAAAPRVADELMIGQRMTVVGAIRRGLIGTIIQVSHYRDFYLLRPEDDPGHLYTDEWFCVGDLEPAPAPKPEPSAVPEGGAFVSVIRSVMYPDRIGAVGRVASRPTVTGRVVVHFEDGEERSFSLSDLQRESVVGGFDTPGGGPDVHVMFGCASCGATADASDHESDAGDWLTESLCPRCGLAETEETANADSP